VAPDPRRPEPARGHGEPAEQDDAPTVRQTGTVRAVVEAAGLDERRARRPLGKWLAFVAGGAVVGGLAAAVAMTRTGKPPSPPERPTARLIIDSSPPGARVLRLYDQQALGVTPTHDIQPAIGARVEYLLRLDGHEEQRVGYLYDKAGDHRLMVPLVARRSARAAPVEHKAPPPVVRVNTKKSRRR
jgi:hypothetical protein